MGLKRSGFKSQLAGDSLDFMTRLSFLSYLMIQNVVMFKVPDVHRRPVCESGHGHSEGTDDGVQCGVTGNQC